MLQIVHMLNEGPMRKITIVKFDDYVYYLGDDRETWSYISDRTDFIEVTEEEYSILKSYYNNKKIDGLYHAIIEVDRRSKEELLQIATVELAKEKEKREKSLARQAQKAKKAEEVLRLNKEKKEKEQLDKLLKKYSKKEPQILSEVAITHKKLLGEK